MRSMKFRARFGLFMILVLLLMSLVGFVVGKYITTIEKKDVVTFTAKLAEKVELKETKVRRNEDGSYGQPDKSLTTQAQEYILIPGLDVPKDPYIVIQGKTEIPAYLFVEVVDNTPNEALRYALTDNWVESNLRAPKNAGATLYVYTDEDKNPVEIVSNYEGISILKDNFFYVDQKLKSGVSSNALTFYAYLEEAAIYKK